MKRKYIWLSACATVLLLSFLIPWVVLLIIENNAMGQTELLEGAGELVSYGELSLARKQQLLAEGELIISQDTAADTKEQQECIEEFREEIQSLVDCGALPDFMAELSKETLSTKRYLALHPESNEAFRYYEIGNHMNIRCIYDGEQKKILAICVEYLSDIFYEQWATISTDTIEGAMEQQLRGWANYYGHLAEEIHAQAMYGAVAEPTQLVSSRFVQGEISYYFGLFYDPVTDMLVWGIVSLEHQTDLAESAS